MQHIKKNDYDFNPIINEGQSSLFNFLIYFCSTNLLFINISSKLKLIKLNIEV